MICKKCGHYNARVRLEPVCPDVSFIKPSDATEAQDFYSRWPCAKCGRYHFPDGTLYSNPYKVAVKTGGSDG